MRTKAEAESEGFTVDAAGAGRPWATRGKIPTMQIVPVMTGPEEAFVEALRAALIVLRGPTTPQMVESVTTTIANVLAGVDAGKKWVP
ncbi:MULTISPECIES: hypothetical protein [unclassified Variovorax]|uniref:hypothetical protein n=1 Tax=unclassified Variovorax TaxID=663243 RepID=UPI000B81E79A|nr:MULTISPECIES: hypothetical protein [unclassified Variovorax]